MNEVVLLKISYKNELNELIRWISNANAIIGSSLQMTHLVQEVQQVTHLIAVVSNGVREEYPLYSKILPEISSRLFVNFMGTLRLNTAAFGELAVIVRHINEEPFDLKLWDKIHQRIQKISKGLYADAYYDSAAEKSIKEVETRLREKFKELKPNITVPTKVGDVIGALLTENGALSSAILQPQAEKTIEEAYKHYSKEQWLLIAILLHTKTYN